MSAHFESQLLKGMAKWMRIQAKEERVHAMKFFDYVIDRGSTVAFYPIEAPTAAWNSPLAVFEHAYQHEQKVTGLINDLVDLAIKEKDLATSEMLQWFVKEQVEEEASASEIVGKLKMIGDAPGMILMIDHALGKRE
jgi:ferritin